MKKNRLIYLVLPGILASLPGIAHGEDFIHEGIAYSFYTDREGSAFVTFPEDEESTAVDYSGEISIPQSILLDDKEIKVEGIGENAFKGRTMLTKVILPPSITEISNSAFYNCRRLASIDLPSALESIGEFSFYYCMALEEISLPEKITEIPQYCFSFCQNLERVNILGSVNTIGNYSFFKDSALTSINLKEGLESIGDQAFAECQQLEDIKFPVSLASVGKASFLNNYSITSLDFSRLKNIEMNAFSGCIGLESIDLSNYSSATIGSGAFKGCYGAKTIKLPALTILPSMLFAECSGFEVLELPEELTGIGSYCFSNCSSIEEINIPESVNEIGEYAFATCSGAEMLEGLTHEMTLGEGCFQGLTGIKKLNLEDISSIPKDAFAHCRSLEELIINSNVERIAGGAFTDCPNLSVIYVEGLIPPVISINSFDTPTEEKAVVKVDPEAVMVFQQSAQWNRFLHIEGSTDLPWAGVETTVPSFITISDGEIFSNGTGLIHVYDLEGRLCGMLGSDKESLSLPKGIYILKSSGQTAKVKI